MILRPLSSAASTTTKNSNNRKRQEHRQTVRRHLLFATVLFVLCYVQIASNFFVYYWTTTTSSSGKSSSTSRLRRTTTTQLNEQEEEQQQHPQQQTLVELQTRLGRLENGENQEESSSLEAYHDDGRFVAFTIRDARRTTPVNVLPHGFHIFDVVDVGGGGGGYNGGGYDHDVMDTNHHREEDYNNQTHTKRATLYHNGKAMPRSYQARCQSYTLSCYRIKLATVLEYLLHLKGTSSTSTTNRTVPAISTNTTYFFFMEADHHLCVPLTEIRRLAYQYQRYFLSTGIGFSGYLMNRTFLEDFVERYEGHDAKKYQPIRHTRTWYKLHNVSAADTTHTTVQTKFPKRELRPQVVAKQLLLEKRAWSVTRRYLTSHTVLVNSPKLGGGEGMPSLTNLLDGPWHYNATDVDDTNKSGDDQDSDNKEGGDHKDDVGAMEERRYNVTNTTTMAPLLLGLSRHLPRCLEPHRGIWSTSSNPPQEAVNGRMTIPKTTVQTIRDDVDQWDFFAYDLCPDSEVFPCEEGQLEKLYDDS